MENTAPPLILTVTLNREAQDHFNALRQAHFPPERNYLDAHLTLFHHLPPGEPDILQRLETLAAGTAPFTMQVTGLRSLGRGVAYVVESPLLVQLHKDLQTAWRPWLTPQDRQKLWPHITVQNKVEPAVAKTLLKKLSDTFVPHTISAEGFTLWEYLGGPWRRLSQFRFSNSTVKPDPEATA